MDIRKCRQCGKAYQFIRSPFCPDCALAVDQQYEQIRDYLEDEPKANINQIARELKISERVILYLLREGRLTLSSNLITCERCKKTIDSGRYCADCLNIFQNSLTGSRQSVAPSQTESDKINQQGKNRPMTRPSDDDSGMHIHRKNRRG